jgi:hypothetical protein
MARKLWHLVPRVRRLPITEACINVGALIQQVHRNDEYVNLGKTGAVLTPVDEFEDYLELRDIEVKVPSTNALALDKESLTGTTWCQLRGLFN